jgi:hypothetical protein
MRRREAGGWSLTSRLFSLLEDIMFLQDPKYTFMNDAVFNRSSGERIPSDEPVFVFRARDIHAIRAILYYRDLMISQGLPEEHVKGVECRAKHFRDFAEANPHRMKQPDTDTSTPGWE